MPVPAGRRPPQPKDVLPCGARVPTAGRLRLYGLTAPAWVAILERQGWGCAVCGKVPPSGGMCTDHEHFKGWRKAWRKLTPEQRRGFVRGILCPWCNGKLLGWRVTTEKAARVLAYLKQYDRRRPKQRKGKA